MEISKGNNRFYIGEEELDPLAVITYYHQDPATICVDHTIVSEELRGQQIAGKLVERIIAFARENNFKIVPECSYAAKYLQNHPEHHDVLK